MLLFQKRFHAGLVDGSVTLTFRLWPSARVKPGGRYRVHPIGVVEVDAVELVAIGSISDEDARLAGFEGRSEMIEFMKPVAKSPLTKRTTVFRVALRHGGDGDRVPLALETELSDEDVGAIHAKLAKLDAAKPWTSETLRIIGAHPRVAASKLAEKLGREKLELKEDIRKLKKLGLTQSFEVGYEISPRGVELLKRTPAKPVKKRRVKSK